MASTKTFDMCVTILFSTFPHRRPAPKDIKLVLSVWFKALERIADNALLNAVTKIVTETKKLYPDDNLLAMILQYANPTFAETEGDCMELIATAVRDFGYMREDDAIAWLETKSELIASVARRVGYQEICRSTNPSVMRGQIKSVFKAEKERAKQFGGVVKTAKHLNNGLPTRLVDMTKNIAKRIENKS